MNTLSVPFHFTTTFLVAVGSFAAIWLAVSRPEFAPPGLVARIGFALGWLALASAETLHGAQILGNDLDGLLVGLRATAYLLLLLSLLVPLLPGAGESPGSGDGSGGPGTDGAHPGAWAATPVLATAGPAVLGLAAGLAAMRGKLDGSRRLGVALGFLGTSEILFAQGGAASGAPNGIWVAAHGLHFLGGVALGWWLWRAFRVSIQARFVAALVMLLILVIALVSSMVTQAFAGNVSANAYDVARIDASGLVHELGAQSTNWRLAAQIIAQQPAVVQYAQARSTTVLTALASLYQTNIPGADFVAFFAADQTQLGLSAAGKPGSPDLNLTEGEILALQGSGEVKSALNAQATDAVDDIGLGSSKVVLIGSAPITATATSPVASQKLVGVVAIGQLVSPALLDQIRGKHSRPVTIFSANGTALADNPAPTSTATTKVIRRRWPTTAQTVVQAGGEDQFQFTAATSTFYSEALPVHLHPLVSGPGSGPLVAVVVVANPASDTQTGLSRTLFLGALAATLFAVGAAIVSGTRITRPIRDLTAAAERVRRGDLTTRVPVEEADEVGVLTEAFNQMTASLDSLAGDLRESAFEESRIRDELETILQSMTDGLVAVDKAGKVMTLNREAERITGIQADRARGMEVEEVLSVLDAAGSRVELPIYRLAAGTATGFAATVGDREGRVPVAVTSTPISNELGASSGAVAVLRDLTSDLEVDRMKTEFLSNISHELRTPLTPIKGYADLLRRKVVSREESVTFLNVIVASTERMERIVDMLVDFSAMQAGRMVLRTGAVNLDRATADLVAKWQAGAPTHTFGRAGFEDLPPVSGDARLLPRAIDELIDNAIKFSPDGGPVSLRGRIDPDHPDYVLISVTDRGIGIPARQINRILQDFVQVDASETREFGGLGLGLAYVRRIIEAHKGELLVESPAGRGSTFTLRVPIWKEDGGVRGFPYRRPPREWPGVR